jgi:CCR4-NOT transcription complex subunit 1
MPPQALCILMEGAGLVQPARDALQYPATACPDLLLISMAETRTQWNLLQRDVFAALLPQHMAVLAAGQVREICERPLGRSAHGRVPEH